MLARILTILIIAALAVGGYFFLREKKYPAGVLISKDPIQAEVNGKSNAFIKGDYDLTPLAMFEIEARVLGVKHYYDAMAKVAQFDLAAGWGPMSDQSILDQLEISQGNRFYFYEWPKSPPIPKDQIITHSTNIHLIPADSSIQWRIKWLRRGNLVRLKGFLVEVNGPDIKGWRSSLSRGDTGNGACEILWVESLEKMAQPGPE